VPSRPDVWSVDRALVLDSTCVCFSLAIFLGFIRLRITVTSIRYNSLVERFARVREVSKHLHPFYVKRGICQLIDHAYDMSMLFSVNTR
jgi:hypothetical protein